MIHKICVLSFLVVVVFSKTFSNAPLICELSGIVKDSLTGEGLPYATIQLSSEIIPDFFNGTITDTKGNFSITDIPSGKYKLTASYMGYKTREIIVDIQKRRLKLDIRLTTRNVGLSEIEITTEKQLVEQSIEKTTINVTKNTTITVGTAIDVMQTLPSIDFDVNGILQYRGSNKVTVLLNGQKSELVKSLDQIPSDQIEKIEIINNPSAKYDAEGMSGIINIVLKSGQNGNNKTALMVYAGFPETIGGNAGYSGVKGKSNFFINAGINHKTKFQIKEHLRKNYENPDAKDYYQYDRMDEKLNDVFINANYGYTLKENQTLSLSLVGSKKFNSADRGIDYKTLDKSGQVVYESYKDIDISLDNFSIDGNMTYNYRFSKKGQQLKANLHYSLLDQLQEMNNVYYPEVTSDITELQNTYSKQLNNEIALLLDYSHPINDSLIIETGYQFSGKDLLNDFTAEDFNKLTGDWVNDTALSNEFKYQQYINAVYINMKIRLKYFDIQAGLRGEYTYNKQDGAKKDDYLDLFPSVNISKPLNDNFNIFIAYNRRINRPTIKMLNPFTNEYADILNMHIGNPNLKPEYVNSFEAGTHFKFKKLSGSGSVYYRLIDQAISRVKSATNDSALIVTYMNLDKATLLGGDLSVFYKPFVWWSINASGNIFYTHMMGEYGPNIINRKLTGWTASLSNTFKLPAGFGLQVSGYYRSELPDVMGTYMERYYMDIAINKNILKGKGKLIFKVSDVFNTYRYGLDLEGVDENGYKYSQSNRRKNESQYFILSFTYNIDGKQKQQKKTNFYLDSYGK